MRAFSVAEGSGKARHRLTSMSRKREAVSADRCAQDGSLSVVCIHGVGMNRNYFDVPATSGQSLLSLLRAQGFSAIALDRPGYGTFRGLHDKQFDVDYQVQHLFHQIDDLIAIGQLNQNLVYVGHSLGGYLSLRLASERPEMAAAAFVSGFGTLKGQPTFLGGRLNRKDIWYPSQSYSLDVFRQLRPCIEAPSLSDERYADSVGIADIATPDPASKVYITVGAEDKLWSLRVQAAADSTGSFPFNERQVYAGVGHNLGLSRQADHYHHMIVSGLRARGRPSEA